MRASVVLAATLLFGCADQTSEPVERASTESRSSEPAARAIGNPFPAAAEVRLFVETGHDADGHSIMSPGKTLSRAQRDIFEAALRIEPLPESLDACFIPHHFFRYFDAKGGQVGEIEVCFCCDGVKVTPGASVSPGRGEQFGADYAALKRLVQSMGERTDVEC